MKRKPYVSIYTDGSCDGNPGPGGFAAILKSNGFYREIVGNVSHSTNNRMELAAVIRGLSEVKPNSNVTVFCDSQYVVGVVNEGRLEQWQGNGWRRIRTGEPVKNADQWVVLSQIIKDGNLNVRFVKIAAHRGYYFNNRADYLAKKAAQSA